MFTEHEVEELKELIVWWRAHKGGKWGTLGEIPVFKGPRKKTSFFCNEEIAMRGAIVAREEGYSLSRLVEILLWRHLGRPQDVLAAGVFVPEPDESEDTNVGEIPWGDDDAEL
jgi:hypothetical protein